jgi:GDP-L-fucose synthase
MLFAFCSLLSFLITQLQAMDTSKVLPESHSKIKQDVNKKLFSLEKKRVFVAGHNGMVGSSLIKRLSQVDCQILTVERKDVDLRRQDQVEKWMEKNKPDCVFLAAAKVGGIYANQTYPADFIYDNLMIGSNIIHSSYKTGVKKLLFIGSSCIYPKFAKQPIKEDALLTGELEPTNEPYAVAKIAGIKLTQSYRRQYDVDYISVMPTNLYGENDHFDPQVGHMVASLIFRIHKAKKENQKSVELWGTGQAKREFMYVEELSDALVFLMENYSASDFINIGTGEDLSVLEIATIIAETIEYKGNITLNPLKPDGMLRKCLNVSKLNSLGWKSQISLKEGIKKTYQWFLDNEI